jgi:hypothetical protein
MNDLDGDQMQDLIIWLAGRERDIADGVDDFFELREIFFSLFGRNAGEPVDESDMVW